MRAAPTDDDIERFAEGGTEPTIRLRPRLATALNADVRLTAGHDIGSVCFETTLPELHRHPRAQHELRPGAGTA